MAFVYREDLGCSVYEPPLTGLELKHNYFIVRDECAESLIYLHKVETDKNNNFFGWGQLVDVADTIGLPIKTTCQFLEKWGKVRDGLFEQKGLTSKQIRQQVEAQRKAKQVNL